MGVDYTAIEIVGCSKFSIGCRNYDVSLWWGRC